MDTLESRDGQLIHHWYIACCSHELKTGRVIQRKIYDQNYALFRTKDGKVGCLVDRCLHRASLLSAGTVKEQCLGCPYHGWSYDQEGHVTQVPSEGPGKIKEKRKLKSLPVRELDGVIWVYTGKDPSEAKNVEHWRFPFYGEKGWVHYYMITDFDNEVTNLVENFMDVPHTVTVHKGWFRNSKLQEVPIDTQTKEGKVTVTYHQPNDQIGVLIKKLLNPNNEPMEHTDCFIFPNVTRVDYKFGPRYQYIINSQCTPVSTMKSRVYTYIAYKLPLVGLPLKPFIQYYTRQVIEQDVWIMNIQRQNLCLSREAFQSTPADEPHRQIEKLRERGVKGDLSLYEIEKKVKGTIWI